MNVGTQSDTDNLTIFYKPDSLQFDIFNFHNNSHPPYSPPVSLKNLNNSPSTSQNNSILGDSLTEDDVNDIEEPSLQDSLTVEDNSVASESSNSDTSSNPPEVNNYQDIEETNSEPEQEPVYIPVNMANKFRNIPVFAANRLDTAALRRYAVPGMLPRVLSLTCMLVEDAH